MNRVILFSVIFVCASGLAFAVPLGLNGLSAGIGAGGLTDGYLTAEYGIEISKYVCVGPELGLGFGGKMAVYVGGAGRLYVIPDEY